MPGPHPALARSASALAFELPDALTDAITEVWAELEALEVTTLSAALEHVCAGLTIVPHPWAKRRIVLADHMVLEPGQALRLALLTLGELELPERRSYEGRVEHQPWFRAYQLLSSAYRDAGRLAALGRPLRWLVVDAVLDGCELDGCTNAMQEATGWLWTSWRIDRDAGLDIEPTLARMWRLAERGFSGDGYDDGSFELTFDQLADEVHDTRFAAELRTVHALMDYASFPWQAYERAQLREALSRARDLGLDLDALRELCRPVIGTYFDGELPLSPGQVPEGGEP